MVIGEALMDGSFNFNFVLQVPATGEKLDILISSQDYNTLQEYTTSDSTQRDTSYQHRSHAIPPVDECTVWDKLCEYHAYSRTLQLL